MTFKGWTYAELWKMTDAEREYWVEFAAWWAEQVKKAAKDNK